MVIQTHHAARPHWIGRPARPPPPPGRAAASGCSRHCLEEIHGKSMEISMGFPGDFPWDFPRDFPWDFHRISTGFPRDFPWKMSGFPMINSPPNMFLDMDWLGYSTANPGDLDGKTMQDSGSLQMFILHHWKSEMYANGISLKKT